MEAKKTTYILKTRLQQHNLKIGGNITGHFPLGRGRPPKSTDPRPLPPTAAAAAAAHQPPSAIATVSMGFKARNNHLGGYVRWNSGPNAKIMESAINNLDGNGMGKVLLIVELGFLF
jgi:hypothetical protein